MNVKVNGSPEQFPGLLFQADFGGHIFSPC